jgi:hypothetical protein
VSGQDAPVRARIFRRDAPSSFHFAGELDAEDADNVWRQAESGARSAEPLSEGDVVYIGDVYFELDGDLDTRQADRVPARRMCTSPGQYGACHRS